MVESDSPVSVAILTLLSFISISLAGYLTLYCYTQFKERQNRKIEVINSNWLDYERKPLIPGNFHAETIQPVLDDSKGQDDDEHDQLTLKEYDLEAYKEEERDYSKLGRIIFVMRYNQRREELMVRLVQIEGMPASQNLYSPNSAYVDVQLKYTGQSGIDAETPHEPPRLDIALQQVYFFTISPQQMVSHSLEFQVNTFDDQFRRYVSGLVEVNLSVEMGDDIFTGVEVVFVKEILDPIKITQMDENEDYQSAYSDQEYFEDSQERAEEHVRSSSPESNMSWEHESKELLSVSMNSLYFRCSSEQDLTFSPLTDFKRSHSIGYLPTNEWTIKDIPLDDDPEPQTAIEKEEEYNNENTVIRDSYQRPNDLNIMTQDIDESRNPPPESFYHIVPVTPLNPKPINKVQNDTSIRRVAYRKHPKRKQLGRSLTISRRSAAPRTLPTLTKAPLDRSSSWPSLAAVELESSNDVTPEHKHTQFFNEK